MYMLDTLGSRWKMMRDTSPTADKSKAVAFAAGDVHT